MNLKENTLKNEQHFDALYENVDIAYILKALHNSDSFLADAKVTDASWVGMYYNNFDQDLKGKKVLELGCGDCLNAAIMSVLGAEVYANDISQVSGKIIDQLNENYNFERPIRFVHGNFLESDFPDNFFDIVVGKAFVHHLTKEQEVLFTEKIVKILKPDGLVRYFEPAINSKFLDQLRYMIPVSGRPSSLQRKKFKLWKEEDPHPDRDDSSKAYRTVGEKYFTKTEIICFGSIERYYRLLPYGDFARKFRRFAFKIERLLPKFINQTFSRSQLIIYQFPKKEV
ncbi:class I SAM-dependent methyltransferase [Flavobacterium silvisoli]|uniref:Class I SAM-dependent methyltransferase n=1 Tax=Flavobacterium silvisoli TaxID=2529433 RepID=A0A4Q9YU98_9FLAO|nr:class I SAM-dependent methyltransferase [Flavobacterium silvisoli]TBX67040.1 class I SAM-dependent methyltransferase [Flavobacterium silvisoli]